MNKRFGIALLLICVVNIGLKAQTHFYFDGLGRANVTSDVLNGKIIELDADSLDNERTTKKAAGGYTLFDLGINLEKSEKFKAQAILRVNNKFGLFYGGGASLEFRRLIVEGVIGKGIKYEIGDIDVEMTPYTVYNFGGLGSAYESEIFKQRRDIQEYENFNNGNKWRLQGAQSYTKILFNKGIKEIDILGFASRTNKTNYLDAPDRVLSGAKLNVNQGIVNLGFNYVGYLDIPLEESNVQYKNNVMTVDFGVKYDLNDDMMIGLLGETGSSNTSFDYLNTFGNDTTYSQSGFFYDAKLVFDYKKIKTKINVGYKSVGKDFLSPSAQTRRFNHNQSADMFNTINIRDTTNHTLFNQVEFARTPVLYDRITQENNYNRAINATLNGYLPGYNNINPYGLATPNRQGLYVNLVKGDTSTALNANLDIYLLNEPTSLDGIEMRSFLGYSAGIKLDFKKLLKIKREGAITLGYGAESTTRAGANAVDLKNNIIDAGIHFEVLKKVDLMAGIKLFSATGNEIVYDYEKVENFNTSVLNNETDVKLNFSENIISFGARTRFSENSSASIVYNMVTYNDKAFDSFYKNEYGMNQLFLNYTIKF